MNSNNPYQMLLIFLLIFFLIILIICYFILHLIQSAQFQQLIILLLSGFIQLYAGIILFKANSLDSFKNLKGIISLVPVLMDLKGNLEITLASRMSTLANTSYRMHSLEGLMNIIKQNIVLIHCQVTIISLSAVLITIIYLHFNHVNLSFGRSVLLYAIALSTGSITCSLIGSLVTIIISFISLSGYDPDDVATSLAASFGDLITVSLIKFFTNLFYKYEQTNNVWTYGSVVIINIIIIPYIFYLLIKNAETRQIFIHCWPPLIISTTISIISGFIFESTNEKYKQITLLLPILAGFTGNSISIIASLISTNFHRIEYIENKESIKWFLTPKDVFCKYEYNEKISRSGRSHVIHSVWFCLFAYLTTIVILNDQYIQITVGFVLFFLLFASILLMIMIFISCNMAHIAFHINMDPSDTVIPIMTSFIDFGASLSLWIFFGILFLKSDPNIYIEPII